MINSVTRILTRWLQHETHGVSALLDSVPRASTDRRPADVYVLDDVDSPEGAEETDPPTGGMALLVMAWSPIGVAFKSGRPVADAAPMKFALFLMQRADSVESQVQGRRDAGIVTEAAIESLSRLSQPSLSSPHGGPDWRREQSMKLLTVDRIDELRTGAGIQQMKLCGGLLITVSAHRLPATPNP